MTFDERIKEHLVRSLLPAWRTRGVDPVSGGFHERLDLRLEPVALPYRRLLTQCRQVFTFAEGAALGDLPWAADIARRGFEHLCQHYRVSARGGWKFALGHRGPLPSETRQLYAHAFVLLACWSQFRSCGDEHALVLARETVSFLNERFRAPDQGFVTALDEDMRDTGALRQQNPHMHLFEACLFLFEETREEVFGEVANAVLGPFLKAFIDRETFTLVEHFDEDWSPNAELGSVREPGHHFEWVWLIHRWLRLAREREFPTRADQLEEVADRFLAWALARGTDREFGGVFDEVGPEGKVLKETKRIWPVCEAVKALRFASAVRGGLADLDREAEALGCLFWDHYLHATDGTWAEVLDRDLTPRTNYLPSTTLYHIVMMIRELEWLRSGSQTRWVC